MLSSGFQTPRKVFDLLVSVWVVATIGVIGIIYVKRTNNAIAWFSRILMCIASFALVPLIEAAVAQQSLPPFGIYFHPVVYLLGT